MFPENVVCTLGIEFVRKLIEIDGKDIMIQIWDTAGMENL